MENKEQLDKDEIWLKANTRLHPSLFCPTPSLIKDTCKNHGKDLDNEKTSEYIYYLLQEIDMLKKDLTALKQENARLTDVVEHNFQIIKKAIGGKL